MPAAFLLATGGLTHGAAFQLNLQGLRQLAMGGGGMAVPWDASSLFYNPGAMAQLTGFQAYGGVVLVSPHTAFAQQSTGYATTAEQQTFTPFSVYLTSGIKKIKGLSAGIGIYTPFGTGLKWNSDWTGRYVSQETSLQSFFVQPTVAYQINKNVSAGAGFVYAFGTFQLNRAVPIQDMEGNDGAAQLKGRANGIGFNAGLHVKAGSSLQLGLSYRSKVVMKVNSGDAIFTVPQSVSAGFPATAFKTKLPLPSVLSVGLAYQPLKKLTITADADFTNWKSYDSLRFDFAQQTAQLSNIRSARRYQNVMALRIGGHYAVTPKLALMLGGSYDASPVRDHFVSPDLPDADRFSVSGGISYKAFKGLDIILAAEYLSTKKRDAVFDEAQLSGQYQTKAFSPGIGISYTF